jgi:hypothetical protein
MKKAVAIVILLVFVCTMAFAEESAQRDVTYRTLYNSMIQGVREDDGTDTQLKIENATVWKLSDEIAGFTFQGEGWQIIGEADMETGIITRLFCRLPYTEAGLLMTYVTAFVLSEETSTETFISKYVGEKSLLNGNPFPHYVNTLDAGNEENIVYEFTRVGSMALENEENRCEMKTLIEQIQRFE